MKERAPLLLTELFRPVPDLGCYLPLLTSGRMIDPGQLARSGQASNSLRLVKGVTLAGSPQLLNAVSIILGYVEYVVCKLTLCYTQQC
jgi:hypothetical protein